MNISNCPICFHPFKNPLITKCGHSFCELCLTEHLDDSSKCPVCLLEIEKGFLIPNLALQSLQKDFEMKLKEKSTKKDSRKYSKELIYSEFFNLLTEDRELKFSALKLELERIKELKKELGINTTDPPIVLGSKRRATNELYDEKVEKLNENFESLSSTFSSKIDWKQFEKRLMSSTKIINYKEISSFRNCDPLDTSSQIISSIEIDKRGGIFATAGVLKQINLYKLETAMTAKMNRNYPILEIKCDSKISCLSWNPFYEERLGSADYEGIVNIYDCITGRITNSWTEHEKRCWTIDTSSLDPQKILSGSDDCKVKLWNQKNQKSLLTLDIRSNVCSARFSPNDSNLLAVGAADHRVFIFDLRKPSIPIFNEKKHTKAVSYVRFSGSGSGSACNDQLISSSTDSTLRSWALHSQNEPKPTTTIYKGHLNEKNFVGLSVKDDLIVTGSEDNSLYIYDQNLPDPVLKCPMSTNCPLTGLPMQDEESAFVSSVTWTNQYDQDGNSILLAANSTGNIKIISIIEE